jgi:hypothetical protein
MKQRWQMAGVLPSWPATSWTTAPIVASPPPRPEAAAQRALARRARCPAQVRKSFAVNARPVSVWEIGVDVRGADRLAGARLVHVRQQLVARDVSTAPHDPGQAGRP